MNPVRLCVTVLFLIVVISNNNRELAATDTIEQTTRLINLYATVLEDRPVGQVILRLVDEIERHDRQSGQNVHQVAKNTRFHLLPSPDASLFHINTDGSLINAKRLDYEELCDATHLTKLPSSHLRGDLATDLQAHLPVCQLQVRVLALQTISAGSSTDQTGQRRIRTVSVAVTLLDTNDNRPTCTLVNPPKPNNNAYSSQNSVDVTENTPVGSVIATWKLTDRDTVANGITDARLFGTKNGKSPLLGSSELPFQLQFDQTIGPWSAVDLRLILSKNVEYINQPSISKQDHIDEMDVYQLKIILLDSKDISSGLSWTGANTPQSLSAVSCHLQIRIIDINDHNPVWVSPLNFVNGQPVELELIEGKSYTQRELVRLKATDADRGPNARISYQWAIYINSNTTQQSDKDSDHELLSRLFYLDPTSGSLQLRGTTVDFESVRRIYPRRTDAGMTPGRLPLTLRVVAIDQPLNHTERRTSPVGVISIWLIDSNDNSPTIQIIGLHNPSDSPGFPFSLANNPAYPQVVYIGENLPPNEPVAFITVTDEDSEAHGGLSCSLNPSTFDEPTSTNFHAFQLIKLTQQSNSEDAIHSYLISGTQHTSALASSVNYKLATKQSLDREQISSYQLNLTCTDSLIGSTIGSSTQLTSYRMLQVLVLDVNDNAPRIIGITDRTTGQVNRTVTSTGAFVCSVREHASAGTKICQLRAEDLDQTGGTPDTTQRADAFHWWLEESVRSLIDIERETGWLIVQPHKTSHTKSMHSTSELDREVLSEFAFTVYVHDQPRTAEEKQLTATATVLLRITDINDHPPKISEYNYFQVSEGASPGTVIGTLVAVDGDDPGGPNSALTYQIYSYGDSTNSGITTTEQDMGSKMRTSGDLIGTEFRDIKLDENTGTLLVGPNGLDRERQSSYKFIVTVSDGAAVSGLPALLPRERHVVQTVIHVVVEDENDNAPRIIYPESHSATFTVACSAIRQHLPHTIAQIVVNDSDSGINAEVFYHLSPLLESSSLQQSATNRSGTDLHDVANQSVSINQTMKGTATDLVPQDQILSSTITLIPFQIDPQNGLLMIVNMPTDEKNHDLCAIKQQQEQQPRPDLVVLAEYRFRVVVTDRGMPPLSNSVPVIVRIVPNASPDTVELFQRQSGQLPSSQLHLDRFNLRSTLSNPHEGFSGTLGGSVQRSGKPETSPSATARSNSHSSNDTPFLSSLSSPDVFWAATICLTIATGVLIFLIVLITMVTCHRRMKPIARHTGGTRQNDWAQSDEGTYGSQYGARPFDHVEMNISKNPSVIPDELFTLNDESGTNIYLWSGRGQSAEYSPDRLGSIYCGSPKPTGYSTLMTPIPHCRTLQNTLIQRSLDTPRTESRMRSSSNTSPCASSYEGYQKLIPSSSPNEEAEKRTTRRNKSCLLASNRPENNLNKLTGFSAEDLRKDTVQSVITCAEASLPDTITPTVLANNTHIACQDFTADKQDGRAGAKKKNEVSFV